MAEKPLTDAERDQWMERLGGDDLWGMLEYCQHNEVTPEARAALDRALARERGGGRKSRDHRRGRRG